MRFLTIRMNERGYTIRSPYCTVIPMGTSKVNSSQYPPRTERLNVFLRLSVWCHDRSETWFTTLCILIRFQSLVSVSLKFETVISAKDKLAHCLGFYSRLFCAAVVLLVICRPSRAAFSFAFALSVYRCFAITLQRFKCHPVVCWRLGNKRNAISIDAAKRFSTFYLFFSCFNVL